MSFASFLKALVPSPGTTQLFRGSLDIHDEGHIILRIFIVENGKPKAVKFLVLEDNVREVHVRLPTANSGIR